jgi:subtilisin family serine protease
MMKVVRYSSVVLLLFTLLAIPAALAQDGPEEVTTYVVVTNRQSGIPWNVERDIARSGGVVTERMEEVGALVVATDNPAALRRIRNVEGLVPNVIHTNGPVAEPQVESLPMGVNPPITGDDDFYFDRQYGHDAVDAPEAWAQGYFGQGVTVAVLDEGFQPDHPDLAPNVIGTYNAIPYQADAFDYVEYLPDGSIEIDEGLFGATDGCDTSVDPTCSDVFYTLNDAFSHGTHVAGTIAAADNAFGTIGVAPQANLLMVKVLSEQLGFGLTEWIVDGIIWATDNGADIINMSLGGAPFERNDPEYRDYVNLYNRALRYARNHGVLVFSSAGNDAFDFAANPTYTVMPAGGTGVVAVASTGAYGWAISPETGGLHPMGLDRPAYMYSNFGNPLVDIAAPGGDYELYLEYLNGLDNSLCESAGRVLPCGILDYVFSTGSFETIDGVTYINWYWSVGTSMASPHAAGVAALIKSEMPWRRGEGVWATMRQRAAQAQPDIDFISPLGISEDESQYFGVGRASSDYALPSDYQTCGGQAATLYVTPSGHIASTEMHINGQLYRGMLQGGNGIDIIVGTDGDDMLRGLNGDDIICGGDGDDMIYGTDGNDMLFGEGGNDRVMGDNGLDAVYGGDGDDMVVGGDGDDIVDGGIGNDDMRGDNGIDMMYGGDGDDNMRGGAGDDEMYGGLGNDFISGDDGNDVLYGEDGDDELRGSNGDDELYGGPGEDILNGGPGNNTLVQD